MAALPARGDGTDMILHGAHPRLLPSFFGHRGAPTGTERSYLSLSCRENNLLIVVRHCCWSGRLVLHLSCREVFETGGVERFEDWGLDGDYVGVTNCILGYSDGPCARAGLY